MKLVKITFLFFLLGHLTSIAQNQESLELIEGLSQSLSLTDKQAAQVQNLMIQYRVKLDGILLKHEGEEEPDIGAMIGEVRDERDQYRKDLKEILSKEQYQSYIDQIDAVLTEMFNDLAEIRLMDAQASTSLTDDQITQLTPVIGKSLKSIVQLLFENAGTRLSIPKKVKIGKTVKKIEKEQRAAMENILTPEQMAKYDAHQEEKKKKK